METVRALKMRFALSLVSSLLSSWRYYCSESKTILYLDTVYCKFLLYVSVEINKFKHQYFSTQINLVYLGLVYVTMITGTRSTVVRGVTGVYIADFRLELRYIELDDCKFLLYVSVEINPFKHRYFSTQTSLVYLGLVYVAMITGSHSTVVRGVTGVYIADFRLELRYIELDDCKFLLYVSVEINPFKHQYFSTQINLIYLGLVYVTMITGTRSMVVRGVTGV